VAPVLQCPDCGEKHPLSRVPESGAFPCQGCGRVLKVPEVALPRAAAAAAGAAGAAAGTAGAAAAGAAADGVGTSARPTAAPPTVRPVPIATAVVSPGAASTDGTASAAAAIPQLDKDALSALAPDAKRFGRESARLGRVPWWMRFILWVIAVPLGFFVVFSVARAFNLFTSNQLSDLFLANNPGRFWPAARLLPFVALVTASIVQVGVYLLARWRGRHAAAGAGPGVAVGVAGSDVSGSRSSRSRRG
jgi:hypothetical protein